MQEERPQEERQSNLQQRGAWNTRDDASRLPISLLCETHTSGATRREKSLLTAPVRIKVGRGVVDDLVLTPPVWFDGVDLFVASGDVVGIGYPLAVVRVVGIVVVRSVVGDVELVPTAYVDGVDFRVSSFFVALISDPLATR